MGPSSSDLTYYGPDEPNSTILFERTLFIEQIVTGASYGILLAIFAQLLPHIFARSLHGRRLALPLAIYSSFMFVLGTISQISGMITGIDLFIDHRNYPGGPRGYAMVAASTPSALISNIALVIATCLTDGLMVYRCFIFFGSNFYIVALPVVLLVGSFTMGTLLLIRISNPENSLWDQETVKFIVPFCSLSLALSSLVTIIIVTRLIYTRRKITKAIGLQHTRQYISVAAILIESTVVATLCSLLFLIPYARGSAISNIFQGSICNTQISATLLIILRIAQGRAWDKDKSTEISLIKSTQIHEED